MTSKAAFTRQTKSWQTKSWQTKSWQTKSWQTKSWQTKSWQTKSWQTKSWQTKSWQTKSWQTRVGKLKLVCVNGTKTVGKQVGKLLATNRTCLYSRQLFVLVNSYLMCELVWHFTKWGTRVNNF